VAIREIASAVSDSKYELCRDWRATKETLLIIRNNDNVYSFVSLVVKRSHNSQFVSHCLELLQLRDTQGLFVCWLSGLSWMVLTVTVDTDISTKLMQLLENVVYNNNNKTKPNVDLSKYTHSLPRYWLDYLVPIPLNSSSKTTSYSIERRVIIPHQ
jgi:hypothetical protein